MRSDEMDYRTLVRDGRWLLETSGSIYSTPAERRMAQEIMELRLILHVWLEEGRSEQLARETQKRLGLEGACLHNG